MSKVKKEIKEIFNNIKFLPGKDKQLIGYAEMFGNDCIPLYSGINYKSYNSPKEAIEKITLLNPKARTADGFNKCIIGHLKIDSGSTILLYDKEAVIEQIINDFSKDKTGIFIGEDDIETSAIEHYDFNIIGAYIEGIPAFAVLYSK